MHLTMAGLTDDADHTPPQSPCAKGIVQALVCEVKKHMEGIDADVQVTNERIGVLKATQLATDTKLGTMEASVARIDDESLKHIRSQGKLNRRHAKWVEFIEYFPYQAQEREGECYC
jgi:hypothetical protein